MTKYGHVQGQLPGVACYEAGHPVPDKNSFRATQAALDLVAGAKETDTVLFLLSGGGSALFEKPLIPGGELQDITQQLLACGGRHRRDEHHPQTAVGGQGRAVRPGLRSGAGLQHRAQRHFGRPSGYDRFGACRSRPLTCAQAQAIAETYGLRLSGAARACLQQETPKALDNVETYITGSVRELCAAAAAACGQLGYQPVLLTDHLDCEAREAGRFLADIARTHAGRGQATAYLAGGRDGGPPDRPWSGRGAIRSWPWRPLRASRGCRPRCSAWARTAPTAPPTPPEAMWTGIPQRLWLPEG